MKLFIVAALIAAVSAARLEHLERGYLPPAQNYAANSGSSSFPTSGAQGNYGLSTQGSQYNAPSRASTGFGNYGRANDFVANSAGSNGFGANSRGSNGFGSSYGSNGASGRNGGSAATSNQYLPPNYGAPGSNGGSIGSSIKASCFSCGSSTSPQRYQQNSFGSQGHSIPSTQYGSPQSFIPSSTFESQPSYSAQHDEPAASRQYLAPKASSGQNAQQPFDENTGYIY